MNGCHLSKPKPMPMPMKLEFNLKVDGDKLAGECKMGMMGKAAVEGTRA